MDALFGARLMVSPFCLCTWSLADVDVAYTAVLAKEKQKTVQSKWGHLSGNSIVMRALKSDLFLWAHPSSVAVAFVSTADDTKGTIRENAVSQFHRKYLLKILASLGLNTDIRKFQMVFGEYQVYSLPNHFEQ